MAKIHAAWFREDLGYPERILPDSVPIEKYLESESSRKELETAVNIDVLTGLQNRGAYNLRMKQLVEQKARNLGILFIDGINFGRVNKEVSYAHGDNYIQRAARILGDHIDNKLSIGYRIGGDETIVIAEQITSQEQLDAIGQRLVAAYAGGNDVDGKVIPTVSIGGMYIGAEDDDQHLELALSGADAAMKEAKNQSKEKQPIITVFHQQNGEDVSLDLFPSSYVPYEASVFGPLDALPIPQLPEV